ncbi:MAG: PEGA domain-containing protein [Acidobacteria bacterium]|nr:PEGA domain-containing protein [Acidobacteriota bacterium]
MSRSSLFGLQPTRVPGGHAEVASWYTPGWSDAFGDRLLMFDNTTAGDLELLRFRSGFDAPAFETALRDRVEVLRSLHHEHLAGARSVRRLGDDDGLALVSTHVMGRRLSEMLTEARGAGFAADLLGQLAPALADLHAHGPGLAHGTLSAGRVLVTPAGRLVIAECALGGGLSALQFPAERLRTEFGLAVGDDGRLDQRLDLMQLGLLGLSLLVGRPVAANTPAAELAALLDEQSAMPWGPAYPHLRSWLDRALRLATPFETAAEAAEVVHSWPSGELAGGSRQKRVRAADIKPLTLMSADAPRPTVVPINPDANTQPDDAEPPPASPDPDEFDFGSVVPDRRDRDAQAFPPEQVVATAPVAPTSPAPIRTAAPATIPAAPPVAPRARRQPLLAAVAVVEALVIVALSALLVRAWRTPAPPQTAETHVTPVVQTPAPQTTPVPASPAASAAVTGPAAAATTGRLEITSDPSGARVAIDGSPRGTTPLTLTLPPGEHGIVLTSGPTVTRRTVNVASGSTSTLMVSLGALGSAGGWVAFDTPLDLQVSEGGSLLGTTKASRLMLPAGTHRLELSSPQLGIQDTLTVDVEAGKTVSARVPVPNGSLSLNALPWANVWLDNQPLGTTPVANVAVPVGQHDVIWRHPQLGERRQAVVVHARTPVRVVVDLTK